MQSCLWSYDISKMDKDEDYRTIIGQGLNWGDRDQIRWIQDNYSPELIKEVLMHPSRGMWYREKLRRWLKEFEIMIDPLEFEAGVIDLIHYRRIKLMELWFKRQENKNLG